ncbi:MAG: hypothetical protein H6735_08200 [Alphaproteobacteria bacterium]|nr:hypothetical protein [Alphaproteobacteria bacterium]
MIWGVALLALAGGEVVARTRSSRTALLGSLLLLGALAGFAGIAAPPEPTVALGAPLVLLLGAVTLLARPPSWRQPSELAQLTQTTALVALTFAASDLATVAGLWLVSLLPGLRFRERTGVSRRPFLVLSLLAALPVIVALAAPGLPPDAVWLLLAVGAAIRMGVPPFSPLVMTGYERLPLGRRALVAAARPSVALLLAARAALPEPVESMASPLQAWAALAALAAGLQGLAATTPRRSLGAMATTQAAILLYGLVSPGEAGVAGALVQWAGLGLSLVGLGLVVEAVESRVGRRRAEHTRGLLGPAPGLALLFLLFAATMSGFPGTTGFAGEDLVMQAQTTHPLAWRTALLGATALNGATMLRMFARSFLGPTGPEAIAGFPPVSGRERLTLGAVALAVATLAVAPTLVR